jgi:hypothetical protein
MLARICVALEGIEFESDGVSQPERSPSVYSRPESWRLPRLSKDALPFAENVPPELPPFAVQDNVGEETCTGSWAVALAGVTAPGLPQTDVSLCRQYRAVTSGTVPNGTEPGVRTVVKPAGADSAGPSNEYVPDDEPCESVYVPPG